MDIKATDLSAKLLATENVSVVRGRVRTASFDILSRVLTLPMWKDMTPEIEDMLVGHEVGHALYTGEKYMEPIKENPKMMSYLNVLEDVRIEKLIKRKYPGLRKRMNAGYKQLNERDFFGVKQVQDFNELILIDKINLYFKAGFDCGISFDAVEKSFVTRAEHTETIEDVIALAHEVYDHSKEQLEQQQEEQQKNISGGFGDEDAEDADGDIEDYAELEAEFDAEDTDNEPNGLQRTYKTDTGQNNSKSVQQEQEDLEQKLESKTERIFKDNLDSLADESTEYIYWKFNPVSRDDVVVSYKTILADTKTSEQWNLDDSQPYATHRYIAHDIYQEIIDNQEQLLKEFNQDSARVVNYLVKEFEMKKSATLLKRAQVSKIGSLDMSKVYAYKLKDDLFKRVTTLPQGKNHGMVMLVDWSGSMGNVIEDTIKQVINLAMFCRRVQIPYRVFAFTSHYIKESESSHEDRSNKARRRKLQIESLPQDVNFLDSADGFNMLELFSSKMSTTEFNSMIRRVVDPRFYNNTGYGLGGTPLNESLVWCYDYIGKFIKEHQVEKMSMITLSDGEGNSLHTLNGFCALDSYRTGFQNKTWKRIATKHFIRDEYTQKTYELTRDSGQQQSTILRMIKDRYDISMVGFFIVPNRRGDLTSYLRATFPGYNADASVLVNSWRESFRKNGFASVKNTGRDDMFLVPHSSTKIEEGSLNVSSGSTSSTIAKSFGKYLNVKKTSRVLLSRFVALVA